MADSLLQQAGYECATKLPIHPDKMIPDIHCHQVEEVASFPYSPRQCFYKTHFSPAQMALVLGKECSHKMRYVYLYRNPEDALVSYYFFKLRYQETRDIADAGPDDFCLNELGNWIQHARDALSHSLSFEQVYLLRYEDLHKETSKTLGKMWRFLEIDIGSEICLRASDHMRFDALQKLEIENDSKKSRVRFFRKGRIGNAVEELKPETIDAIRAKTSDLMAELDCFSLNAPKM